MTTPDEVTKPSRPPARPLPAIGRLAAWLALFLLGASLALLAVLHTGWGMRAAVNVALGIANPWPHSTLTVGGARPGFLSGIELHDLRLQERGGRVLASVDTLRVRYGLPRLLGSPHTVGAILIAGPAISMTQRADGSFDLIAPFLKPPARRPARTGTTAFDIGPIELRRGSLQARLTRVGALDTLALDGLFASLGTLGIHPGGVNIALDTLDATLHLPPTAGAGSDAWADVRLAGSARLADSLLSVRALSAEGDSTRIFAAGQVAFAAFRGESFDGLQARVEAAPLAARDIARVTGVRGPGDVRFVLEVQGQGPALDARLDALALGGTARLRGHALPSRTGPFQLTLSALVRHMDLGTFTGDSIGRTVAEARVETDLTGASRDHVSGPVSVVLDGTRWSGAVLERATLSGRFTDGALALRADGLANDYRLTATAGGRPLDARPTYQLDATLAVPPLARSAGDTTASPFVGDVIARLRGEGYSPATAQLQVELHPDRAARSVLGDAALDARLLYRPAVRDSALARFAAEIRSLAVNVGPHTLEHGSARVEGAGARLRFTADAQVDRAAVRAEGSLGPDVSPWREAHLELRFDDLDLSQVFRDTALASRFAGTLDVDLKAARLGDLLAALSGRGRPHAGASGRAALVLDPSSWRHQRIERLDLSGQLAGDVVALQGDFETSFGSGRLRSEARPFDAVPSARIDPLEIADLDLGLALRGVRSHTDLSGRVTGEIAGRDAGTLRARLEALLDGSSVNRTRFDRLRLDAALTDLGLDARLDARAGVNGADLHLQSTPGLDPTRITVAGDVRFDDLDALLGRDLHQAAIQLTLAAELERPRGGTLVDLAGDGHLNGWARAGKARLDTITAEAHLASGTLEISRLYAHSTALEATGSGPIALTGAARDSSAFQIVGVFHDLGSLAPLIGASTLSVGTGGFAFSASGPPDAMRLSGALTATRPHLNQMWADSLALSFQGVRRDSAFANFKARFDARALSTPPFSPRDAHATATWDGRMATLEARSEVASDLAQDIALRYEPGPQRQRILLDRLDLTFPHGVIGLKHPTEIELGERFHVNDLQLVRGSIPQLTLDGGIEPGGTIDLHARIDTLDVGALVRLMGEEDLRGGLSGAVVVTGTREQPRLEANWRAGLIAGKRPVTRIGGSLLWEGPALAYRAEFLQSPGHRLELSERLPMRLAVPHGLTPVVTLVDSGRSGTLSAEHFDLSWFQPLVSERVMRDIAGFLNGNVDVRGEYARPELAGSLTLERAGIELPRLGVRYTKSEARIAFKGRTATLERVLVHSGAGTLEVTGTVTMETARHPVIDFKTTARRFEVVNTTDAKVEISGNLAIAGEGRAPHVTGTVEVLNTSIYLQGSSLEKGVETVDLTEADYRELQERFGYSADPQRGAAAAALDSVDVDLGVRLGQNVWARRRTDPIISLEMDGNARIRKPRGGVATITGHFGVQSGRSYLSFLGRRFDITSAEVVMPGPIDQIRADVAAQYLPSATQGSSNSATVLANARIEGSTTTLDLRSEPYMERGDLINYLATGKTQGELSSGTASGLAVGAALGTVGGAAGRSLGFQVVQVTQDSYGGQTLSAGNYVNPKTYLGFRQPVLEGQNNSTTSQKSSYATEFEIEVEAMKRLLFNMQGGGTQYRFLLRPRLGR